MLIGRDVDFPAEAAHRGAGLETRSFQHDAFGHGEQGARPAARPGRFDLHHAAATAGFNARRGQRHAQCALGVLDGRDEDAVDAHSGRLAHPCVAGLTRLGRPHANGRRRGRNRKRADVVAVVGEEPGLVPCRLDHRVAGSGFRPRGERQGNGSLGAGGDPGPCGPRRLGGHVACPRITTHVDGELVAGSQCKTLPHDPRLEGQHEREVFSDGGLLRHLWGRHAERHGEVAGSEQRRGEHHADRGEPVGHVGRRRDLEWIEEFTLLADFERAAVEDGPRHEQIEKLQRHVGHLEADRLIHPRQWHRHRRLGDHDRIGSPGQEPAAGGE